MTPLRSHLSVFGVETPRIANPAIASALAVHDETSPTFQDRSDGLSVHRSHRSRVCLVVLAQRTRRAVRVAAPLHAFQHAYLMTPGRQKWRFFRTSVRDAEKGNRSKTHENHRAGSAGNHPDPPRPSVNFARLPRLFPSCAARTGVRSEAGPPLGEPAPFKLPISGTNTVTAPSGAVAAGFLGGRFGVWPAHLLKSRFGHPADRTCSLYLSLRKDNTLPLTPIYIFLQSSSC